jgi:nucleoside-diphosphate-sugar epimerase
MRVLFLGGTGNISAECSKLLGDRGHEVLVLSRGGSVLPPGFRGVIADHKDPGAMRAALRGVEPEVVLNFIGYHVGDVQLDFELFHGRIRQYVFISSASVYAKPAARLPITEDAPLGNPWWEYSRKKIACEQWLLERHRQDGFPVTIVRPSHTYSNRWVPNPASSSSYTYALRLEQGKTVFVPDEGENPWTLTAASDFAVGLAGLAGNAAAIGEAFHITSDEVLTWNQIVSEIVSAVGARSAKVVKVPTDFICELAPQMVGTLKGDKANPGVFDNSKIKRFVPEFVCRKPFSAGVRESVGWLRAHPEQQNLNPQIDALCETITGAWEANRKRQR